jgi:hypothetical protein
MDRKLFHPALRTYPDHILASRSGWWNFFLPREDRINWYGDVQLYCDDASYQLLMDDVPCPTSEYKGYRACSLEGRALDEYRERVKEWLSQYDEQGKLIDDARKNPPAGAKPAGYAKLALWMRRGKP